MEGGVPGGRDARDGRRDAVTGRSGADLAVEAAANGLTEPLRARSLAAWFDRASRARGLLRTTGRADLVVVELLLAWRAAEPKHAPTRQGIDT